MSNFTSRILVAVAGLTYKAGTSTIRDSLPLRLVSRLVDSGATVTGWDPAAESFDPPPRFSRSDSLQACVEGADALVVLTAHPELDVQHVVDEAPLVVDFRGVTRGIEAANLVRL